MRHGLIVVASVWTLAGLVAEAPGANPVVLEDEFEGGLSAWQVTVSPPSRVLARSALVRDDFEGPLAHWQAASTTGGFVGVGVARPYTQSSGLEMLYSAPTGALHLTRTFASSASLRAQVYFYDTMATRLGTLFGLKRDAAPGAPNTALGVNTDVSSGNYVFRIDTVTDTVDTGIARSAGWHRFELLVTAAGTYARIDGRPVAARNPGQTTASIVDFVSSWGLTGAAYYDTLRIEGGYKTAKAVLIDHRDTTNTRPTILTRALPGGTNLLARILFYDTMSATLGNMFQLRSGAYTTALGVMSSRYANSYALRVNSVAGTLDTGIARSPGWHLLELIVTPSGTYGKIDNRLLAGFNPSQSSAAQIDLVSTWGLPGQAVFDSLRIVRADEAPWTEQLYGPLASHYQSYGATVPGGRVFNRLLPTLGAGTHSNDLRSHFATAVAWYLHGRHTGDAVAMNLARQVFLQGLASGPWSRGQDVDDWSRGASMRVFARAAHLLWDDLDATARQSVLAVLHQQANTYLDRLPESGYGPEDRNGDGLPDGDTKAEENAWHAAFLSAVVNLFPDVPNEHELEAKARCFAYHSITRSVDPAYCGVRTRTVHDDFTLVNHGKVSPIYIAGVVQLLGEAGMDYRRIGKPVPWEFAHNVAPLSRKFSAYVDPNTFHFRGVPPDWSGAHGTAYSAPGMLRYLDVLGIPSGFSWQQLLSRRSLFYNGIVSEWIDKSPAEVRIARFDQANPLSDSYRWFLDSVDAGEFYASAVLPLPSLCEEALYKERIWAGQLNWACDRTVKALGSSSLRLGTGVFSTAEAYSALVPVAPGATYRLSYSVKTRDLVSAGAQAYGKVIVAQYGAMAREDEPVNAANRIDSGLLAGENTGGTSAWSARSYVFTTSATTAFVRLRAVLGGLGEARGTAWFDATSLRPATGLKVTAIAASSSDPATPPLNTRDGNLGTRWSAFGAGQWVRFDLGTAQPVGVVRIAFYRGAVRTTSFRVEVSPDGKAWTSAYSGRSSGQTDRLESFDVRDAVARYVRIVGLGNTENAWTSLTEVEIFSP